MSEQEKRCCFRIDFERLVKLDFLPDVYDKCPVDNISLGGMFVNGTFQQKAGDRCYAYFTQTSKTTYLTFKVLAKIVRQDDSGIAIKFISMPFESLVTLELILLYESREKSSNIEMKLPTDLPFKVSEEESSNFDE